VVEQNHSPYDQETRKVLSRVKIIIILVLSRDDLLSLC
jgi:hypothetical protein